QQIAVRGEIGGEQGAQTSARIEIEPAVDLPLFRDQCPNDRQAGDHRPYHVSPPGIPEGALRVDRDPHTVVIDPYDVAGEKAVADDPVYLIPINTGQDIIVVHMEIQAVDGKSRQMQ